MKPLIERLAEIEHRQWASWARKLIETEPNLSESRKTRWLELIAIPYDDLSDEWKEYDREWAREAIRAIVLTIEDGAYE